jgi:hypothetical protein
VDFLHRGSLGLINASQGLFELRPCKVFAGDGVADDGKKKQQQRRWSIVIATAMPIESSSFYVKWYCSNFTGT